jgi:hypothetical protein
MARLAWGTRAGLVLGALAVVLAACSGDDGSSGSAPPTEPAATEAPPTEPPATEPSGTEPGLPDDGAGSLAVLLAGAASRSILPTVDGGRDYLAEAPGWPAEGVDPFDPGVVVPEWDQGRVDVGNGNSDSTWVHDDLRATAVALQLGQQQVVLVSTDTYMHFAPDADEIARRARALLPAEWAEAEILVSSTHNHHGPDTAFSVNDDWYALAADETAQAVVEAVAAVEPASASVASGEHRYGVNDVRDPVVLDPRLNVMALDANDDGSAIATIVQWNSHPETTLGWAPPADAARLDEVCPLKGWEGEDCTADGRYLTADYPGVLRERVQAARGGEVLYLNGPLGNQIGPGEAPTWVVDAAHPVGDGLTVPDGAEPLTDCDDREPYYCRSFAKTESIGTQLATAVLDLVDGAGSLAVEELTVRTEPFFTRLTNIGFRVLIADSDIGWQDPVLYTCSGPPAEGECIEAGLATVDDPVITPLAGSQITVGDVVRSRLTHLDLGDVGFLFLPGELPPELVVGLPADFESSPEQYYREPSLHAVGADYVIPGHLLSLVDESITFTVGLGTDELGYWVLVDEYRLRCLDLALPSGATCADLAARGVIESPDWVGGRTCKTITDDPAALEALGADGPAVAAACRYGQALGRELGEPEGHYEETNAAGWDLVDDLWAAAQRLFGT